MKSHTKLTIGCLIGLGIIGLSLAVNRVVAQNNNTIIEESSIPVDDQVRFIGKLESRNSADWNFAVGEGELVENTYQLTTSKLGIRLVEQNPTQWGNTGMGTDYIILVDVYGRRRSPEQY